MDAMEFNKIAGAVLTALLLIFGGSTLIHELNASHGEHEPAYKLADVDTASAGASEGGASQAEAFSFAEVAPLLAEASPDAGAAKFKQCGACHTPEQGGANRVGPNLWNIVNRPKGSVDGFKYSSAMAEKGGEWTFENLAMFIHDPKGWLPGTKMNYKGLKSAKDVAGMLAYLRSLSDQPAPLPATQ